MRSPASVLALAAALLIAGAHRLPAQVGPWFGSFSLPQDSTADAVQTRGGWILHHDHGYLYLAPSSSQGRVYFYDPVLNLWSYSTRLDYPYAYVFYNRSPRWVYHFPGGTSEFGQRTYYDFSSMKIEVVSGQYGESYAASLQRAGLGTFAELLDRVGLTKEIEDRWLTLFVPSEEAFSRFGVARLAALGRDDLREILLYHIMPFAVPSQNFSSGDAPTLQGQTFAFDEPSLTLNGSSRVIASDIVPKHGVIHVIDSVIRPP